jgi:hypothetical protein
VPVSMASMDDTRLPGSLLNGKPQLKAGMGVGLHAAACRGSHMLLAARGWSAGTEGRAQRWRLCRGACGWRGACIQLRHCMLRAILDGHECWAC